MLMVLLEHLDTHANVDVVKLLARQEHRGLARLPVVFCQVLLTPQMSRRDFLGG